jgi:hypothetical protein
LGVTEVALPSAAAAQEQHRRISRSLGQ